VDVSAEGVVNRVEGSTRFTGVSLHVTIAAPAGADRERAARLAEKAERGCLVSASLAAPVTLRVDVVTP
jgi:organic hydroperoxide reductase OsmC/OhrA